MALLGFLSACLVVLLGLWPSPITVIALVSLPALPLNLWMLVAPEAASHHRGVQKYLTLCLLGVPLSLLWFFLGPLLLRH